jgi:hypothetical protein
MKKGIITTIIGVLALLGLAYNAYLNGGFSVSDAIMLLVAAGLIAAKDANQSHTKDIPPTDDPPPGK